MMLDRWLVGSGSLGNDVNSRRAGRRFPRTAKTTSYTPQRRTLSTTSHRIAARRDSANRPSQFLATFRARAPPWFAQNAKVGGPCRPPRPRGLRSTSCCCRAPCSVPTAQCSLHSAPCSALPAQCSLLSARCAVRPAQCSLPSAPCSVRPAQCSLRSAPCSVLSAYSACAAMRRFLVSRRCG